ncbi:hypothetical protein POTOM_051852 [Populus tomentosa]|uniref:Uncharacterized protein n=1 Tax=Populus tomentosa TaxID=118781 RepID=A0A8X8C8S3_POPTO|nr:hypothetical protein POTOM_051852 [Populus tomentosa]
MSGGVLKSSSPPRNGDGFSIGEVGLGVGAGGQMTTAQRMMEKMGRARVIVNANEKKVKSVNFNGTPPTRVLLLRQQVQLAGTRRSKEEKRQR